MNLERQDIRKRASLQQLELMCDYLKAHRSVAVGFNKSSTARAYAQECWEELTSFLNKDPYGAHKNWKDWSKYWVSYKAKLKSKLRKENECSSNTSSTFSDEEGDESEALADNEKKFANLLGPDFIAGLPSHRIEPPEAIELDEQETLGELSFDEDEQVTLKRKRKINATELKNIVSTSNLVGMTSDDTPYADEYDIFGQLIAHKIRKLTKYNKLIAQSRINNILSELEMGEIPKCTSSNSDNTTDPLESNSLKSPCVETINSTVNDINTPNGHQNCIVIYPNATIKMDRHT